ncbi:hypothetical protein GCM10028813_50440 [Ramlibacter alkalitolerans]
MQPVFVVLAAEVSFRRASSPVVTHEREARFAAEVMHELVGTEQRGRAVPACAGMTAPPLAGNDGSASRRE